MYSVRCLYYFLNKSFRYSGCVPRSIQHLIIISKREFTLSAPFRWCSFLTQFSTNCSHENQMQKKWIICSNIDGFKFNHVVYFSLETINFPQLVDFWWSVITFIEIYSIIYVNTKNFCKTSARNKKMKHLEKHRKNRFKIPNAPILRPYSKQMCMHLNHFPIIRFA